MGSGSGSDASKMTETRGKWRTLERGCSCGCCRPCSAKGREAVGEGGDDRRAPSSSHAKGEGAACCLPKLGQSKRREGWRVAWGETWARPAEFQVERIFPFLKSIFKCICKLNFESNLFCSKPHITK